MAEHARPAVAGAGALCVRVELVRVRLVRCVLSRCGSCWLACCWRAYVQLLRVVAGAEHGATVARAYRSLLLVVLDADVMHQRFNIQDEVDNALGDCLEGAETEDSLLAAQALCKLRDLFSASSQNKDATNRLGAAVAKIPKNLRAIVGSFADKHQRDALAVSPSGRAKRFPRRKRSVQESESPITQHPHAIRQQGAFFKGTSL